MNKIKQMTTLYGRGYKLLPAFTLTEVLVSMLIMSLFFIASTKVLTMKQKDEFQKNPHGYYECYYDSSGGSAKLMAHRKDGDANGMAYETTKCYFVPPKGVSFVNIHYINQTATNSGFYYNTQEPIFNEDMDLASPNDFLTQLENVGINTNDINNSELEEMTQEERWAVQKKAFYTYLGLAHKDANIYTNWGSATNWAPHALFVAW